MSDAPAAPLLVLSPHLDDAVLSCGRLLAARRGSVVVTLFAGRPPAGSPLTSWDADSGFAPGDDVMGIRRAEDERALACVGATPRWLEFRDAQYAGDDSPDAIAKALVPLLLEAKPASLLAPLGLFHSDHVRARDAALALRALAPGASRWFFYADAPYARQTKLLAAGLAAVRDRGVALEPARVAVPGASARKRRACACYRSQRRALDTPGRPGSAPGREQLWRAPPCRHRKETSAARSCC